MVEFRLTEEQRALQRLARGFAAREIKPIALERERIEDPMERFPWEVIARGSRLGLRTLALPAPLGGGGADLLTCCVVGEELAAGDLGVAVAFDQTWRFTPYYSRVMTDAQRERFLPLLLQDDSYLLATGISEPDLDRGFDYFGPKNMPGTGPRTTARRDGRGHWVINGTKHFVSNGSLAKLYFMQVRTTASQTGEEGVSAIAVPSDAPGFSIGGVHDKMGMRLVNNAVEVMEECRVPEDNLMGQEGEAFRIWQREIGPGAASTQALLLGVGRAALEEALAYAQRKLSAGKPLLQHQLIGARFADMATDLEAARLLIWKAAWRGDHPEEGPFMPLTSMCKLFVTEAVHRVTLGAMEILGGYGYMRDLPFEKYLRDALSYFHSGGAQQVHRLRIAESLGGYGPG